MTLSPGARVLDRYVVEACLGEGAMGRVFRGRHEHLDLAVAIKVLSIGTVPDLLERFRREARLMARVRHPNVVAVQDYGFLPDSAPCLVMELVQGEPLEERLRRTGAMPWPDAVHMGLGLLDGLEALHGAGILHRDLKPSNVILMPGTPEVPKLIDLGIALPVEGASDRLTRTGVLVGTPAYMAPEQILCTRLDERSDLYSLGFLIHEALTGTVPFRADTMASVMRRIREQVPPPVAPRGRPPIPPSLAQVVVDACHPDPARRPAKARDLARALAAISPPSPGAAPPETRAPEPVPEARLLEEEPPSPGRQDSAWQHLETTSSLAEGRRYLVAARLPPSRITSRDERRWLATLVEASGRGFTLGAHLWFALQREAEDPRTAQRRGEEIIAALARRYGDAVSLRGGLVDRHFALSGAAMVGGAPLPEALQALIRALSEAGPGP